MIYSLLRIEAASYKGCYLVKPDCKLHKFKVIFSPTSDENEQGALLGCDFL